MFVKSYAGALVGIEAVEVIVEVNQGSGGLGFYLVGLPDNAVKESQERIRSAFENSNLRFSAKKLVVNLAPADLRKEGSAFDLPIAICILAATMQVENGLLGESMILGELSLDGSIKGVKGALSMAIAAKKKGLKRLFIPAENSAEAAIVDGLDIIAVSSLREVVDMLNGEVEMVATKPISIGLDSCNENYFAEDFADVKGQAQVKRAMEIAAAGGHNAIMIGAPGSGKTMLARRLPSIMPELSIEEALETTKIHSVAGKLGVKGGLMRNRPFRSPHHLTSQVALVGGGQTPQPGEVSLAHNGILFLDELPEFGRNVLEVLRQPLEEKQITISRARYTVEYPANFTLVASMNPCPCGYYGHPTKECTCSPGSVHRYMSRISGPLMDRIDLHIVVSPVSISEMSSTKVEESSAEVRDRVVSARLIQSQRFKDIEGVHTNSMMNSKMIREYCQLDEGARRMLEMAMERLKLSARAYDRIIKVARTIADLGGEESILAKHISEAINFRSLDRDNWGR